jgi:hypothetical protein
MDWLERLWREGLGLKEGEAVLLLVDRALADLGLHLQREGQALGARPSLLVLDPPGALQTIPDDLAAQVGQADLILSLYSQFDLAHPDRLMALVAQHRRGRWAYGAGLSEAVLAAAFRQPLAPVAAAAAWWGAQLRRADRLRVTGRAGTDLRLRRGQGPVLVETGAWGLNGQGDTALEAKPARPTRGAPARLAMTNLPGGEAYLAPAPDSPEGWLVVDGALGDIPLGAPVHLRFQAGRLVKWFGDPAAVERLTERFAPHGGLTAARLCEFGVGVNPYVAPAGHAALDEKRFGTVHLALADATGRLHYDCVIEGAQVWAGNQRLSYDFHDYDL